MVLIMDPCSSLGRCSVTALEGAIAQMGRARLNRTQEASGSNPLSSTLPRLGYRSLWFNCSRGLLCNDESISQQTESVDALFYWLFQEEHCTYQTFHPSTVRPPRDATTMWS